MNESRVTNSEVGNDSCDLIDRRHQRSRGHRSFASRATRNSQLATRPGVTLIELLITITIIATLSAVFLGVSRAAMESARAARTKTLISRIHGLLMERWTSYATRRVDVRPFAVTKLRENIANLGLSRSDERRAFGFAMADLRLLATRELMMREMPDSWSDILLKPVGSTPVALSDPQVLNAFPALRNTYLRQYDQVRIKTPPGTGDNTDRIIENQGAECLYLIIMLATGDGEARTLFSEQDIGDTDDDGALEFLDGWGRPIHFIRWPAGFAARSDLMSGDFDTDRDPFDVFSRDQLDAPRPVSSVYSEGPGSLFPAFVTELRDDNPAYRLLPLVYSAGPDGETDIDDFPYRGGATVTSLDPYAVDPDNPSSDRPVFVPIDNNFKNFVFGLPFDKNKDGDDNSLDNIYNHLQDNR